jgi:catechol 2,3-dioxygenase-like lactoylglutathione lyase family enzyme
VLNEAIRNGPVVFAQMPRTRAGTLIGLAGGGLGFSGGMALGLKLAQPDRTVVQVVGDGTFYFSNPQSTLAVSRQYKLPVLTVVLDNTGWAAVKEATLRVYPAGEAKAAADYGATLSPDMDFAKVAEAAGAHGEQVSDPDQVEGAIARCLAALKGGPLGRPACAGDEAVGGAVMALVIDALDHLVVNVKDVEIAAAWYQRVLGMVREDHNPGPRRLTSMTFGRQKINLRPIAASKKDWFTADHEAAGSDDLCFLTKSTPQQVVEHLKVCGVAIEEGPGEKRGAMGPIVSVYCRDPDGSLSKSLPTSSAGSAFGRQQFQRLDHARRIGDALAGDVEGATVRTEANSTGTPMISAEARKGDSSLIGMWPWSWNMAR